MCDYKEDILVSNNYNIYANKKDRESLLLKISKKFDPLKIIKKLKFIRDNIQASNDYDDILSKDIKFLEELKLNLDKSKYKKKLSRRK